VNRRLRHEWRLGSAGLQNDLDGSDPNCVPSPLSASSAWLGSVAAGAARP